ADVRRFQAKDNQLEGIALFAVNNTSEPPRTQMNDKNFEFYLPEGAHVDQAMAMTSGGQPVNSEPVPQKEKNRYAFDFPLRPGETQFQVVYELPYTGKLAVQPKLLYGTQHFVVMLPKTMTFSPADGTAFKAMDDPRQSDAIVQVVTNASPNQPLCFIVSGAGVLEDSKDDSAGTPTPAPAPNSDTASAADRPGGGLGPPIDAPDPLEKYRWFILGGFGVVLTAGAIVIVGRSKSALPDPVADEELAEISAPISTSTPSKPAPVGRTGLLLEALKEEMFQLELDRKQGKVTAEEYEKAKSALDQTLDRALKRNA
ncbi:MAG: carboxypeptidase regulatory-like domain-containing protein, partial [Gemmatimonadales bacterium]